MVKLISLIVIALSIVFIFITQGGVKSGDKKPKINAVKSPADELDKINKYLQEIEFNKKAQAIKTGKGIEPESIQINESADTLEQDLDAGSGLEKKEVFSSFQDEIEAEKIRLQSQIESTQGPDDAYVQQFIENARKDGLRIKLDKNNQIIDIQKIDE